MFTNPLNRKYQTGGSAPTDDQKKDMQGFVTWIKSNVEGFKDKSEQEIAKSLSDMAKSDEGKKSVQDLYSRYQKSKKQKSKFADGGKFQDFICKHGRGGNVECGCGGMVIRGEDGIDGVPDGFLQSDTPVHAAALAAKKTVRLPWFGIGRRRVGATIDQNGGKHFYEWGDINGNTAQTAISIPAPGDTIVKQSVATNRGWIPNTYPQGSTQYETIMERFRPIVDTGVPYKEDGGIVMGKDGLSRRQVRQDKRKVLRAINRPTAGAQYENLMNQTKNWDRFAGMSRLERKNAINQLILNGEKPVVQTPYQPDFGENYVINETTVPYQFFNPTSQVVETPKVETVTTQTRSIPTATTQRSTSTNRRSNIARPEDFPMQEIVIPQISTNIPFGNGSRTAPSNNSTTVATPEQEPAPVFINGRFVNASLPEDAPVYSAPRDSEGNMIIKDEGNGVYWTRDAEGRLQKHEPVRTATIATSAPRRNYSAISGQPLRNGQSTWDLFKQGGQIEKHQNDNGIIDHYRSKWANDWDNIKRGWNNFKDSAFGLVVPTSGTDVALMAAGPMFKIVNTGSKAGKIIESVGDVGKKVVTKSGKSITIIPEGVHGSEKAAKRALTESAPFISQKGELANEAARNINGLRKWLYGGYYNLTTNLPK